MKEASNEDRRRAVTRRGDRLARTLRQLGATEAADDVEALIKEVHGSVWPDQARREYVGTQEAARLLGVSDARVRQLCRSGQLEAVRETARRVSIPVAEIERRMVRGS